MKIGVYGDSFAEKHWKHDIWWRVLQDMGHDVTSYGEGGSNIVFSAIKLKNHAHEYDFNIWVVSSPMRISFRRQHLLENDEWIHALFGGSNDISSVSDLTPIEKRKLEIAKEYWTYLMDLEEELLIGESLVGWMMAKHENLMVIPGFHEPLTDLRFNLRDLSNWELSHYLTESEIQNFYRDYIDQRKAHLVKENNRILAELINQNLTPGIFQTEYSNFMIPTVPFDQIGKRI